MRISAKGRYALAAMTCLAQSYESAEFITVVSISERLGISKIYLEQIFSLLKRSGLLSSVKGSQGGYKTAKKPRDLNVYQILSATELSLSERTEQTTAQTAPDIETAMQSVVFKALDGGVENLLRGITLQDLVNQAEKEKTDRSFMFYI
jgi:Rrf2 family protein